MSTWIGLQIFLQIAALRHRKLEESSISNFKQKRQFIFSSYILVKAILEL
jgi:hypothetical protein